jgi:predicted N-acetyltransferase YhbS
MRLVNACYGEVATSPEWWKWRYFELSSSSSIIYIAVHAGEIVGMRPMAFFRYTLQGRPLTGAYFSAVMVHPEFRRKGIFGALVKASLEAVWPHGADFVSVMPNDLSYPGFIKLGWHDPGDRRLLLRPLNFIAVAQIKLRLGWLGGIAGVFPQVILRVISPRHLATSLSVGKVDGFTITSDKLAERIANVYSGLILRRDSSWLNWRYTSKPWNQYERFEARSADGLLRGIAVTNVETREDIRVGYIVELTGETTEARCTLISAAVSQLRRNGAQIVVAVMSDPNYINDLRGQGFFQIPQYLSPKKFHTVYMPHPDKLDQLAPLRQIANWHQTLGDWDGI